MTSAPGIAPGNVISGNAVEAVEVFGAGAGAVTVAGNLIGLDATGSRSLQPKVESGSDQVGVDGRGNKPAMIGGPTRAYENVISGFAVDGVHGVHVSNDYIGTDISGTHAVPNHVGVAEAVSVSDSLVSGNSVVGVADVPSVTGSRIGTNRGRNRRAPECRWCR